MLITAGQRLTESDWSIDSLYVGFLHQNFNCLLAQRLHILLRQGLTSFQLLNPFVQIGHQQALRLPDMLNRIVRPCNRQNS